MVNVCYMKFRGTQVIFCLDGCKIGFKVCTQPRISKIIIRVLCDLLEILAHSIHKVFKAASNCPQRKREALFHFCVNQSKSKLLQR